MRFAKDSEQVDREQGGDKADAASVAELRAEIGRLNRELLRAEARIAELEAHADVDSLLDILNRRGFERELKRSLAYVRRYNAPVVLMFVDLDGFKSVNDAHGHAVGDKLLRTVACALATHVRASDVVGRLGGDEFGVLMWNIGGPQAVAKARELEGHIASARLLHGEVTLSVGASIGSVPLDAQASAAAMIEAADRAMYARKREKRPPA